MDPSRPCAADDNNGAARRAQLERRLLGCLILRPNQLPIVSEYVTAAHFADAANRRIYTTLVRMHDAQEPVDLVLLRDKLILEGCLRDVGGAAYLIRLFEQADQAFQEAAGADYARRPAEEQNAKVVGEVHRCARLLRDLGPTGES